jgi:hypothetical protein
LPVRGEVPSIASPPSIIETEDDPLAAPAELTLPEVSPALPPLPAGRDEPERAPPVPDPLDEPEGPFPDDPPPLPLAAEGDSPLLLQPQRRKPSARAHNRNVDMGANRRGLQRWVPYSLPSCAIHESAQTLPYVRGRMRPKPLATCQIRCIRLEVRFSTDSVN